MISSARLKMEHAVYKIFISLVVDVFLVGVVVVDVFIVSLSRRRCC